jgi:hypothetical protein
LRLHAAHEHNIPVLDQGEYASAILFLFLSLIPFISSLNYFPNAVQNWEDRRGPISASSNANMDALMGKLLTLGEQQGIAQVPSIDLFGYFQVNEITLSSIGVYEYVPRSEHTAQGWPSWRRRDSPRGSDNWVRRPACQQSHD